MIPQLVTVRFNRPDGRPIRIWIPVLPMLLLLSPIVVLAVLGTIVACVMYGFSVPRTLGAGLRFCCALPGTRIQIDDSDTAVFLAIR